MKKFIFIDVNLKICDKSFEKTPQGYLMLQGIISRSGKQNYYAGELGLNDRNPGEVIVLDRPIEEVTDSMAVVSFINMPITDEHPQNTLVNSLNIKELGKGIVLDAEPTDSGHVKTSLMVQDEELIKKIEDGKVELSAGYTAELEFSDDGKSAIQRKIRGNHVAFVDSARCGKECSIFDSKPKGKITMAKLKIKGVEYEVADSVAPIMQATIYELETTKKALKDAEDEVSKEKAKADAADEKAEEMKKKIEDEEEDEDEKEKKIQDAAEKRVEVLLVASKFLKDYDSKGKSLIQIKADVLKDAFPDLELKDRDNSYIGTRFEILMEDVKMNKQTTLETGLSSQMLSVDVSDSKDVVFKARQRKIDRNNKSAGEKS